MSSPALHIAERFRHHSCVKYGVSAVICFGMTLFISAVYLEGSNTSSHFVRIEIPPKILAGTNATLRKNQRSFPKYIADHDMSVPKYMEIPKFGGRTGNHLFQIALLLSAAHKFRYTPLIPSNRSLLHRFLALKVQHRMDLTNVKIFTETGSAVYNRDIEQLNTSYNWSFSGLFQSYKYHNETLLRSELRFTPEIMHKAIGFVSKVRNGSSGNVIGIQIRRGDFMKYAAEGFTTAPLTYINRSMAFYRKDVGFGNVTFIVLSNDMTWCKENIKGSDVVFSPFTDPGTDLAVASLCDHMIITSGSFSWWAGWFSGGKVVFYKNYPRPGSRLAKRVPFEDYYPTQWIGLE